MDEYIDNDMIKEVQMFTNHELKEFNDSEAGSKNSFKRAS